MVKIFHWEIVFPKVLWLFELQEAVSIRKKTQKLKFGNLIDDFISSLSKTNQNKMSILIWVLKLLIHNKDEDFKSLWDCAEENKQKKNQSSTLLVYSLVHENYITFPKFSNSWLK